MSRIMTRSTATSAILELLAYWRVVDMIMKVIARYGFENRLFTT